MIFIKLILLRNNNRKLVKLLKCELFKRKFSSNFNPRVRFAPSPTGYLHLGGLRTALYNFLFAKKYGGQFIIRIEDTDNLRTVLDSAKSMEFDLNWISIFPDESPTIGGKFGSYTQSERLSIYKSFISQLINSHFAYRCFCSKERLQNLKEKSSSYDNFCRNLSENEKKKLLNENHPYCVRFTTSEISEVTFKDLIFGERKVKSPKYEGDFIIQKSTGTPTYHLASVVDDHLMKISHVLRGEDWLTSIPKHLNLYKALGWQPPQFGHLPHLSNLDGTKLSKRQESLHVGELRRQGYDPLSVLNFIKISGGGFSENLDQEKIYSMQQLIEMFDVSAINRHSAPVDVERLNILNRTLLQNKISDAKSRKLLVEELKILIQNSFRKSSSDSGIEEKYSTETYIEKVLLWSQNRIFTLLDLSTPEFDFLWRCPIVEMSSVSENIKEHFDTILNHSIETINKLDNFEEDEIVLCLNEIKKKSCVKGALVMKILRLAICGLKVGPPIGEVMNLLGKEEILARLEKAKLNN